jgi:hypothetical protein
MSSDKTTRAVQALLFGQSRPKPHQLDDMHNMAMTKGKRVKRTIDAARTNQNYYKSHTIHQPLLDHYENVDWYERDVEYDMLTDEK